MSKRVKLDKSELIDIILEEVEAELTDEATSLGQKDPKYKKFPSTIYYDDVADEYRAILPVVEKLLEANPQDRPYIADALEMMMFNVRDGIHGPEMDESRLDEEGYDTRRDRNPEMHRRRPRPGRGRAEMQSRALSQFLNLPNPEKDPRARGYLDTFNNIADVRLAAGRLADQRYLSGDEKLQFVAQAMKAASKFLSSNNENNELDERAPDNDLSDKDKLGQAIRTLKGVAPSILKAYENGLKQETDQFMQTLEPKYQGVAFDAWETLITDLRRKLELEEESE